MRTGRALPGSKRNVPGAPLLSNRKRRRRRWRGHERGPPGLQEGARSATTKATPAGSKQIYHMLQNATFAFPSTLLEVTTAPAPVQPAGEERPANGGTGALGPAGVSAVTAADAGVPMFPVCTFSVCACRSSMKTCNKCFLGQTVGGSRHARPASCSFAALLLNIRQLKPRTAEPALSCKEALMSRKGFRIDSNSHQQHPENIFNLELRHKAGQEQAWKSPEEGLWSRIRCCPLLSRRLRGISQQEGGHQRPDKWKTQPKPDSRVRTAESRRT